MKHSDAVVSQVLVVVLSGLDLDARESIKQKIRTYVDDELPIGSCDDETQASVVSVLQKLETSLDIRHNASVEEGIEWQHL